MDREEAVETLAATRHGGGSPKVPSDEDGSLLLLPRRRESPCSCLVVRLCPDQKSTSAHAHVVAGPSSDSSCLPSAAARSPRSSRRCAACHLRPPPSLRAERKRGERGDLACRAAEGEGLQALPAMTEAEIAPLRHCARCSRLRRRGAWLRRALRASPSF